MVLDSSTSIDSTEYVDYKNAIYDFVDVNVRPETDLGLIQFSNILRIETNVGDGKTKTEHLQTIDNMQHLGGLTFMQNAFA